MDILGWFIIFSFFVGIYVVVRGGVGVIKALIRFVADIFR